MLALLGSALFLNSGTVKDLDFLSDDYYKLEIYCDNVTVENLTSFVGKEKDYMLLKEYPAKHGYSVSYNNSDLFGVNIKSGRIFNSEDFTSGKNTAIVNEVYRKYLNIEGNQVIIDGEKYEIIGTFETKGGINGDTRWFVSMHADDFKNDYAYGIFICDSINGHAKGIASLIAKKIDKISGNMPKYALGMSDEGEEISSTGTNFQVMLGLFMLVIVLVAVNSFAACSYWVNERNEEVAVRKLCGANNMEARNFIFKEFFEIILSAFIIGAAASELILKAAALTPVKNSVFLMMGSNISIAGVIIGLLLEAGIGLICITNALKKNDENQIVEVLRR